MIKANSILKNSLFLMGGNLGNYLLTFFNTVIITRYLGPQNYGKYTFVLSIVTMVVVLWNFGLGVLLTRDVSREPAKVNQYVSGVIAIKNSLALVTIIIMVALLRYLNYDFLIMKSVLIFSLATYFTCMSAIFESVFSAFRRMEFNSLLSLLRPVFLFIALSIIVTMSGDIVDIFFCQLIASFLVFIVSFIFVKKFAQPRLSFDIRLIFVLIKNGFPFLMISVVHIVLFKIDHIMISTIVGDEALGLYGAAYTLLEIIITFFPMLIVTSAYPVLSDLYKNDKHSMLKIFHVLFKNLLVIGIPASCGIVLLGREIIVVIYGNEYLEAGRLLSILGCSIWVSFISLLMAWTLTAMDKQHLVLITNLLFMIVNITTNLYAIRVFGASGAAVTTCICSLGGFIVLFFFLVKEKMSFLKLTEFLKTISSSLVMVITILILKKNIFIINETINLFAIITISILVYFMIAYSLNLIRKSEIKILLR